MRERRRGGLIDAFIAAVILLSAVGVLLRMQAMRVMEETDAEAMVQMTAEAIYAPSVACLTVGETLYCSDGSVFGVLEAVETSPARISMQDGDRILTGVWSDGSYLDVTLAVTVQGSVGERGFLREGTRELLLGERLTLFGERFSTELVLTRIVD